MLAPLRRTSFLDHHLWSIFQSSLCWKSRFRLAFGVCSTQMLVEKYNSCSLCLFNLLKLLNRTYLLSLIKSSCSVKLLRFLVFFIRSFYKVKFGHLFLVILTSLLIQPRHLERLKGKHLFVSFTKSIFFLTKTNVKLFDALTPPVCGMDDLRGSIFHLWVGCKIFSWFLG